LHVHDIIHSEETMKLFQRRDIRASSSRIAWERCYWFKIWLWEGGRSSWTNRISY